MKHHQRALGIFGADLNMRADRATQAFLRRQRQVNYWLHRGEEPVDAEIDDLKQQGLLAVDVRVQAAGQDADLLGDVAHRGPGIALLAEQPDGRLDDRRAGAGRGS